MREIVIQLADIVNTIHDVLVNIFGFHMTDKELHFWVIGIIGMATFFVVYFFFKLLEKLKWSTGLFSFVYTFSVMVVLVFAIELQQAITNREIWNSQMRSWDCGAFLCFLLRMRSSQRFSISSREKSKSRQEQERYSLSLSNGDVSPRI